VSQLLVAMGDLKEITSDLLRSTYGVKLEENYIVWAMRMQNILENAECWHVVHNSTVLPVEPAFLLPLPSKTAS
jgi:hypothetical protein